jgi:hypothetical protein
VQIVFLPGETNDRQWWVVWLLAVIDGRQITCGISYQALRDHFRADLADPLPAFLTHRPDIERVMAQFIEQHQIEDDDPLVMRSQDVRRLML